MYEFYTVVDLSHDDPALYPAPSSPCSPYPFRWEAGDGRARHTMRAREASVLLHTSDGWSKSETLIDRPNEAVFTESRMIVYRKENSLRGYGPGRVTCAHIRYSWVAQVSTVHARHGAHAALRVVVDAGSEQQPQFVAFVLPVLPGTDALASAAYLTKAVAAARLAIGTPKVEQEHWDALAAIAEHDLATAESVTWDMPSYVQVRNGVAPTTTVRNVPADTYIYDDVANLTRLVASRSPLMTTYLGCGCHASCGGCSRSVGHGVESCPYCGHPMPAEVALGWERIS